MANSATMGSSGLRYFSLNFMAKKLSQFLCYLYEDSDPTALAIFRILFGLLMAFDVPQERGLDDADYRFGDPNHCFFPLFSFIKPFDIQYALLIYSIMWAGSIGIMLGFHFRTSCLLYFGPYLYFFLLDKSRWNNHSYLFGLTVVLLYASDAGNHLSIDSYVSSNMEPQREMPNVLKLKKERIPRWNYFLLQFQIFLLYFYAGLKKLDEEWIRGYSMKNLSRHQLFTPLRYWLSEDVIDYYMIHLGGLYFDLTVGFMLLSSSPNIRGIAFLLSFIFHGINSQVFDIGMFPYVCVASLVLFCEPWEFPCSLFLQKDSKLNSKKNNSSMRKEREKFSNKSPRKIEQKRSGMKTSFIFTYMIIQLLLPFSHSITKGYNNWTNGLYGYSWDMMIYSWESLNVKVIVKDLDTGDERFLDPDVWVSNDRWTTHGDMAKQYAECIARNLARYNMTNISVNLDVWKSMNKRFQQRIFDPRVDILKAPWSPWEPVEWILPVLQEFTGWKREKLQELSLEVSHWTASSNVIFVADYPGLYLENYLPPELVNVTITLLAGKVNVEERGKSNVTLTASGSDMMKVESGQFHNVFTISRSPAWYMYTFSKMNETENRDETSSPICQQIWEFLEEKYSSFSRSFQMIISAYLQIFFNVPMDYRKNLF